MPFCLATLTLFIQEKIMHYLLGTYYIFDKVGLTRVDPVSYQTFIYLTITEVHKKITKMCLPIMTVKKISKECKVWGHFAI